MNTPSQTPPQERFIKVAQAGFLAGLEANRILGAGASDEAVKKASASLTTDKVMQLTQRYGDQLVKRAANVQKVLAILHS